jgi:hypothetical protein
MIIKIIYKHMKMKKFYLFIIFFILVLVILLSSCNTSKVACWNEKSRYQKTYVK